MSKLSVVNFNFATKTLDIITKDLKANIVTKISITGEETFKYRISTKG